MTDTNATAVPNITEGAVSGFDREPLTAREPSTLAGHPSNRPEAANDAASDAPEVLRGEALDAALEDRGLSKSGTADEKRARVAEYDADQDD